MGIFPLLSLTRFGTFLNRTSNFGTLGKKHYQKLMSAEAFRVYVTRRIPPKGWELMTKNSCKLTLWDSDLPVPQEELLKGVVGVDALFCLLTDRIDKSVIEAAGPQLRAIGTMSVGLDHIDLSECRRRGIMVGYTPDVLTDATAELTVALVLATARRLVEGVQSVKEGKWQNWVPLWLSGSTLHGSTVGIVGLGRIGIAVAKRLLPFGVVRILYTNHSKKKADKSDDIQAELVSMDTLLAQSDFVIVTCALTPHTKEMFNKSLFSKMKPSAIFINTSRGGVVNQDDLYTALKSGQIRAAGLDVTTPEPLPPSHQLLTLDNCVILPHIGSATEQTRNAMSELTARNILSALKGESMITPVP